MSVSSLTRFTVPLDSDQSASSQGLLMPKLQYRFRAVFDNFGLSTPRTELTKQVMSISRPSVSFNPIEIPVYNSRVRLAGKHDWEATTVSLRDDINGNVSRLVGEQLQKQFDFMEQSAANAGIDYKFIMKFDILDGANGANTPTVLETWELYGAFLENVNYGSLDYSAEEPATIELSIRFDNAVQTPLGSGVGSAVTRGTGSAITG